MRLLIVPFFFIALLFTSCRKQKSQDKVSLSSIKVKKNGIEWSETAAVGSLNTSDSMVTIAGAEDTETFTIRFKKPVFNTKLEELDAGTMTAPFRMSAAIVDMYHLDSTKPNKVQILVIDNINKRLAGDFYLYLKRDEKYGPNDGNNVYQGRFDVRLEEFSF